VLVSDFARLARKAQDGMVAHQVIGKECRVMPGF
jgi:hypothetical protein